MLEVANLKESEYLLSRKTSAGALYIFALWCTLTRYRHYISVS
jgi:hypothetical protein